MDNIQFICLTIIILAIVFYLFLFPPKDKEQRLDSNTGGFEDNHGFEKSAEVMTDLFRSLLKSNTEGWVKIYAKNLNGEISGTGEYFDTLLELIESKKHKIRVIIDEPPKFKVDNRNAYDLIKSYEGLEGYDVEIISLADIPVDRKALQDELKEKIYDLHLNGKNAFEEGHFAINSLHCFRFEYNNREHLAKFFRADDSSVGNLEKAKIVVYGLNKIFDTIFSFKNKKNKPISHP